MPDGDRGLKRADPRTRGVGAWSGRAGLTQAALGAGFSNAAHLTRSFRRMVGIAPSAVALIAESG
jgi:AraC-like DNA-binding protein